MAAEETRKLMCRCGKQLGTFTTTGLELYCRFSEHETMVPYTLTGFRQATAFVEALRRQYRRERGDRPV